MTNTSTPSDNGEPNGGGDGNGDGSRGSARGPDRNSWALLTRRNTEIFAGDDPQNPIGSKRYFIEVTRVRHRIEQLREEIPYLKLHPTLYDELVDVVCETDIAPHTPEYGFTEPVIPSEWPEYDFPPEISHPMVDLEALRDALPGRGEAHEARVKAILAMYDILREGGEATKSELIETIDPEETGYGSADLAWSNIIMGVQSLKALPGVTPPGNGYSVWTYDPGDAIRPVLAAGADASEDTGEDALAEATLDARVAAVVDMYDILRERGEATRMELAETVDLEATGFPSVGAAWSNLVGGVESLSTLWGVVPPTDETPAWTFRR